MSDAIDRALQSTDKVTLWGADAPHFEPGCAEGIRLALNEVDTVLCPSEDGGFYALGSRVSLKGLLEGCLGAPQRLSLRRKRRWSMLA